MRSNKYVYVGKCFKDNFEKLSSSLELGLLVLLLLILLGVFIFNFIFLLLNLLLLHIFICKFFESLILIVMVALRTIINCFNNNHRSYCCYNRHKIDKSDGGSPEKKKMKKNRGKPGKGYVQCFFHVCRCEIS